MPSEAEFSRYKFALNKLEQEKRTSTSFNILQTQNISSNVITGSNLLANLATFNNNVTLSGSYLRITDNSLIISGGTNQFSGFSLAHGKDTTAGNPTYDFIDFRNFNNTIDSHIFSKHNFDGSSELVFGITRPGSKTADRRVTGIRLYEDGTEISGNLFMNSGAGSSLIAYGVRAWVNFDGTGPVGPQTIRAKGSVTSVIKNSTGNYTIFMGVALTDYCVNLACRNDQAANSDLAINLHNGTTPGLTSFTIQTARYSIGPADSAYIFASVIR